MIYRPSAFWLWAFGTEHTFSSYFPFEVHVPHSIPLSVQAINPAEQLRVKGSHFPPPATSHQWETNQKMPNVPKRKCWWSRTGVGTQAEYSRFCKLGFTGTQPHIHLQVTYGYFHMTEALWLAKQSLKYLLTWPFQKVCQLLVLEQKPRQILLQKAFFYYKRWQ